MTKTPDESLKKTMAEIAEQVSGLPEHLQQAAFSTLLNRALDSQQLPPAGGATRLMAEVRQPPTSTFGEYYATFPADLSIDDKLLVACSFAEAQSDDRTFTIGGAHDLLKDIGIKLTNATVYAKRMRAGELVITIGKAGKNTYKFRLSPKGHKALKELKEQKQ